MSVAELEILIYDDLPVTTFWILQLRANFYMLKIFPPHTAMNILLNKKYFQKLNLAHAV